MRKTVLITGTSSGLGKTAARHFAANDWNVVATMRTPSAETELVDTDGVLVTRLDVQDRQFSDDARPPDGHDLICFWPRRELTRRGD
jgi:NAD(P)-dependent dehydrogenase (short-subunit alcohol dehydrogenase family)